MSSATHDEEDRLVDEEENEQRRGLGLANAPANYAAAINQDDEDDVDEEDNEYDQIPGLMTKQELNRND